MILNRKKLEEFVSQITLDNYLSARGGDAFVWLHKTKDIVNYTIKKPPVEDEIYFYEGLDFFNFSKIGGIKFFIEKNDEVEKPIKILFYEVNHPIKIDISINGEKKEYTFSENLLIDLGFFKSNIPNVIIFYDSVPYDITDIIKSIKHTTLTKLL